MFLEDETKQKIAKLMALLGMGAQGAQTMLGQMINPRTPMAAKMRQSALPIGLTALGGPAAGVPAAAANLGVNMGISQLPPGEAGILQALRPNVKNLPMFLAQMAKYLIKSPAEKADVAAAFTKARYPKRGEYIEEYGKTGGRNPFDIFGKEKGNFQPTINKVAVKPAKESINIYNFPEDEAALHANTAAHESQHAIDFTRQKSIKREEFYSPEEGGTYVGPNKNYKEYKEQNVEARAFRAGDTAEKEFNRLLELLGIGKPEILRLDQPITKEWLNQAYQLANQKKINRMPPETKAFYERTITPDQVEEHLKGIYAQYKTNPVSQGQALHQIIGEPLAVPEKNSLPKIAQFLQDLYGPKYKGYKSYDWQDPIFFSGAPPDAAIELKKRIFQQLVSDPSISPQTRKAIEQNLINRR